MRLLFLLFSTFICPLLANASTLTIKQNDEILAELTLSELQKMPVTSYTTPLPWFKGESRFTGVRLSYLITEISGGLPDKLHLRALNDYSADISKSDIQHYQPIVAYFRDGKPMKVRDKGPFWLIYSLAEHPELDTPQYQGQMVWQLESIQVVSYDK